jgi:benzoate-CoA ligase family protein
VSQIPDLFNAADYFVDRHLREGRSGRVAIECGDERVTYGQLADRVGRFGEALRTRFAVRQEERVLLWLVDGPPFFYAFWGAIRIGAIPVPVNTMWTAADLAYVLTDCRARVAVVSASLLPTLQSIPLEQRQGLEHVVVADGTPAAGCMALGDVIAGAGDPAKVAATCKDEPAFWLYSSGSTGAPKACVHLQHDMVVCASTYAHHVLGITEQDRCFSVAKLFFAYGLGNAGYFPLAAGGTAILWPGAPTAANVYAIIERHRPTLLFSVPTNYGMLLACHPPEPGRDFDLSSIRRAASAGEALPPALFDRFKARFGVEILDGIGSTEVLHMFISNFPGRVRPGSSGTVVPGYDARIVDDEARPVPAGAIGNLLIKGDSTCALYWNQHERTKATIEGHWIRTGDKYHQDADGYFWHAGRSDDMLKVGGIWVSPVEVENVLMEHPAVKECAVVGHPDHDRLVKPAAHVVLAAGVEATNGLEQELLQFVRSKLAEYKRPRWIYFLAELPKTATGKTQRFRLRRQPSA